MTHESMDQAPGQPQNEPWSEPQPASRNDHVERTPVERMAGAAYTQAGEAADALRRGELLQQSQVDPLADSDDRLIAMLSYATQLFLPVIMPLIVLLSESSKKRPFQRYHAVQSLALVVVFWGVFLMASIAIGIVQIIPVLGWFVALVAFLCLTPMYFLGGMGLLLYYGYQAYKGRRFAIPGITSFLRDQGWL
ncbi:MAG: DUF4870 domain-containing protein [Caldilineaceae bacterium]|jgi:uncharacterized membrane protein|nr:DUF4870 domain-containing protein [Caldilineaceae bacterium]